MSEPENTAKNNHEEKGGTEHVAEQAGVPLDHETPDQLTRHDRVVNLRRAYPIAHRAVLIRCLPFVLIFLSALGVDLLVGLLITRTAFLNLPLEIHRAFTFYIFWIGLLVVSLRLFYEELYHALLYYGVEADHFVVSQGVILRRRASLHLTLISDVLLVRRFRDLLLLLYSLEVANPSPEHWNAIKIHGLPRSAAIGLQDFLTNLIRDIRKSPATM